MLFGYADWQMDWWIARIRERRATLAPDDSHVQKS